MRSPAIVRVALLVLALALNVLGQERNRGLPARLTLKDGWLMKSSAEVKPEGDAISTEAFVPERWYPTSVPSTVLSALTRNGVYPDLRIGLNSFRIPDASDEFNQQHDLAKFSHLPDKRNPWKDPYWYRTEFTLPEAARGRRVWLNFDGINYRADVWLNGRRVADASQVVGSFSRYRFDVTEHVRFDGKNCLAVKMHQMDHPGMPDTQLDVVRQGPQVSEGNHEGRGPGRCSSATTACRTVPDRNIGLWQDVYLEFSGPVEIRDPFVVTRLPLPQTSPATLQVSADAGERRRGAAAGGRAARDASRRPAGSSSKKVELAPGETKQVVFSADEHPALRIDSRGCGGRRNYGPQNLYHLGLRFEAAGQSCRSAASRLRHSPGHARNCTSSTAPTGCACSSTARRSSAAAATSSRNSCSSGTRNAWRPRSAI